MNKTASLLLLPMDIITNGERRTAKTTENMISRLCHWNIKYQMVCECMFFTFSRWHIEIEYDFFILPKKKCLFCIKLIWGEYRILSMIHYKYFYFSLYRSLRKYVKYAMLVYSFSCVGRGRCPFGFKFVFSIIIIIDVTVSTYPSNNQSQLTNNRLWTCLLSIVRAYYIEWHAFGSAVQVSVSHCPFGLKRERKIPIIVSLLSAISFFLFFFLLHIDFARFFRFFRSGAALWACQRKRIEKNCTHLRFSCFSSQLCINVENKLKKK